MIQDIPKRPVRRRNQTTYPESPPPAHESGASPPKFIRLPRPGMRCYWTGLTRSALNALILGKSAPVTSLVIARNGASRGVRLICFESLMNHLDSLVGGQMAGSESGKEVERE